MPNSEKYTGHFFRATSATFAAEAGCSIPQLQQIGTWKSAKVASAYVQNSDANRQQLAKILSKKMKKPQEKTVTNMHSTTISKNSVITEPIPSTSKGLTTQENNLRDFDSSDIPEDLHDVMPQAMDIKETYSTDIPKDLHNVMSQEMIMDIESELPTNHYQRDNSKLKNNNGTTIIYNNCTVYINGNPEYYK